MLTSSKTLQLSKSWESSNHTLQIHNETAMLKQMEYITPRDGVILMRQVVKRKNIQQKHVFNCEKQSSITFMWLQNYQKKNHQPSLEVPKRFYRDILQ